jgi:LPXTG-motif cell wall-anchored protein
MKTLRNTIAAVALAAVAFLAVPAAANAGSTTVDLTGFEADSAAVVTVDAPVAVTIADGNSNYNPSGIIRPAVLSTGTVMADATGTVRIRITAPDSYTGPLTVTVTGTAADGSPLTTTTTASVTAAATGGSGLPATGVDAASMAGIWVGGGVLLLGGLVVTVVAARRKSLSQTR